MKQTNVFIYKVIILLFFLSFLIGLSLKIYPYKINSYYTININMISYVVLSIITPFACFTLIIVTTYLSGYLKTFSIDKVNIIGSIISSIYVAISEEIFARGLIFNSIYKKYNNFLLATLISSSVFTLFHIFGLSILENYPIFIFYFIYSIIISYVMVLSNSLIPCFLFHFSNNLLNKLVDFDFGLYEKIITQSSAIIFFPYIIPILLLGIYLIIKQKFSMLFLH